MSREQEEIASAAYALVTTGPSDLVPQPSRFTKSEKRFIVGFVAFVGLFRQIFIMPGFETLPN